MDWPRTIRLVYASVGILGVCAIMFQVIVIQTGWNTNRLTKEFNKQESRTRHVTQPCPCMTTSIIIKITRVSACEHLTGSQLVVMVLRAQWALGTIAQFFHFVAEEKKKDDKRTKAFYDWAITSIPVMTGKLAAVPHFAKEQCTRDSRPVFSVFSSHCSLTQFHFH